MPSRQFEGFYLLTKFGRRLQRLPRSTGQLGLGKHHLGKIFLSMEFLRHTAPLQFG